MKLSRGSWHVKLNDWTWGQNYSTNTHNLCPYFWGTITAVLLSPLMALIKGLSFVFDAYNNHPETPTKQFVNTHMFAIFMSSIFFFVGLPLLFFAPAGIAQVLMVYIPITLIVGSIIVKCIMDQQYELPEINLPSINLPKINLPKINLPERKPSPYKYVEPKPKKVKPYKEPKEKRPNMTIEMAKAWKKKHCPLVEWDD